VVLALLVAGGLAFVAAGRAWVTAAIGDGEGPGASFELTGSDVAPAAGALGVVIVAAALAVLASGGWFRRVIGLVVVLVSGGGAWATFTDPGDAIDRTVAESVTFSTGEPVASDGTIWPWVALAAFGVAAVLGAMVARYGAAWPTMGRRYEAPGTGPSDEAAAPEQTEADLWKSLDHGIDPTDPDGAR
jgi:uncharacterized membrane protein (TIGR02234 family)